MLEREDVLRLFEKHARAFLDELRARLDDDDEAPAPVEEARVDDVPPDPPEAGEDEPPAAPPPTEERPALRLVPPPASEPRARRKRLTDPKEVAARNAEVHRLYTQGGLNGGQIATKLGLTHTNVIGILRGNYDINVRFPWPPPYDQLDVDPESRNPERDREIVAKDLAGVTHKRLASEYSISTSRVAGIVRDAKRWHVPGGPDVPASSH
jgi:hypothetical protein